MDRLIRLSKEKKELLEQDVKLEKSKLGYVLSMRNVLEGTSTDEINQMNNGMGNGSNGMGMDDSNIKQGGVITSKKTSKEASMMINKLNIIIDATRGTLVDLEDLLLLVIEGKE